MQNQTANWNCDGKQYTLQLRKFRRFCQLCHASRHIDGHSDSQINFEFCCQLEIELFSAIKVISSSAVEQELKAIKMHGYASRHSDAEGVFRRVEKKDSHRFLAYQWTWCHYFGLTNIRLRFSDFLHHCAISPQPSQAEEQNSYHDHSPTQYRNFQLVWSPLSHDLRSNHLSRVSQKCSWLLRCELWFKVSQHLQPCRLFHINHPSWRSLKQKSLSTISWHLLKITVTKHTGVNKVKKDLKDNKEKSRVESLYDIQWIS